MVEAEETQLNSTPCEQGRNCQLAGISTKHVFVTSEDADWELPGWRKELSLATEKDIGRLIRLAYPGNLPWPSPTQSTVGPTDWLGLWKLWQQARGLLPRPVGYSKADETEFMHAIETHPIFMLSLLGESLIWSLSPQEWMDLAYHYPSSDTCHMCQTSVSAI